MSLLRAVVRPTLAGALATLLGLAVLSAVHDEVRSTVAGAIAALLGYGLAIALLDRQGLRYAVATVVGLRRARRVASV